MAYREDVLLILPNHMSRNVLSLTLLSAVCCLAGLFATSVSTSASAQEIELPVASGDTGVFPRYGVDVSTPRSGDDDRVFGRVSAFFPLSQTLENNLTFLSTSARLDSAGRLGGSVSLGHRLAVSDRTLLGGYLAYDARDTGSRTFSQIGLGAELLGDRWRAGINGYIPVGTTSAQVGGTTTTQATEAFFQGSQLLLSGGGLQAFESALGGLDVSAGLQLGDFGEYGNLWGTGTAYYLADTLGGSIQLDHHLANRFRFGAGVQSDGIFGTQAFLSVGMSLGGSGVATRAAGQSAATTWAHIAGQDVRRNSSIVVRTETRGSETGETVAAVNPSTGQAYRFRHVTPDAGNAQQGNGTLNDPFTTLGSNSADTDNTALSGVSNGDVVYVSAGDSRTNRLGAFTIPAGVQVYSNADAQTLATQLGEVALPGTGTGVRPLVDGDGGNGITIGGSNAVLSGFEITDTSNGIFADGSDGVMIQNNVASGSSGIGIFIRNSPGAVVENNVTNNTSGGGILVRTSDGAVIQNNVANNNSAFGIAIVSLDGATIQNNQLDNNQTADFSSALSPPAAITLAEVTGTVTISENVVTGTRVGPTAGTETLEGQGIAAVTSTGAIDITIDNNTVRDSQGDGIGVGLAASAPGQITITNNIVTGNGGTGPLRGDGIQIAGEDFSTITLLRIENNTIDSNLDDGIDVSLNQTREGAATLRDAVIQNNRVRSSANGQGVTLRSDRNSDLQITVQNNILNNNASDGLRAESSGNSGLCLALTDNTSNDGFRLSELASSSFAVVDLTAIAASNAGSFTFNPNSAAFTSVNSLSDCPGPPGSP